MTVLMILAGSIASVLLLFLGVRQFAIAIRQQRQAVHAAELTRTERAGSLLDDLDGRVGPTRLGRWLTRELDLAGLSYRPVFVLGGGIAAAAALTYAMSRFISGTLAVLGVLAGALLVRRFLKRAQTRRREAFVNQLPELARVLANASHAGLSLPTAIGIAAGEMTEPARSELGRVSTRLNFGAPLGTAIQELNDRVGSRETNVLMSTLIVASRSGGSLVGALRDIAETLDQRKETRREVTTILSQAIASSNLIIFIGVGVLLALNSYKPGTVDAMLRHPVGQVCLALGATLFAVGFTIIRRMARVEP